MFLLLAWRWTALFQNAKTQTQGRSTNFETNTEASLGLEDARPQFRALERQL